MRETLGVDVKASVLPLSSTPLMPAAVLAAAGHLLARA